MLPRLPSASTLLWQPPPGTPFLLLYLLSPGEFLEQVPPQGWEDLLEEGMETHPRILAQEIPRTEEPGGLQSMGSLRVGHD